MRAPEIVTTPRQLAEAAAPRRQAAAPGRILALGLDLGTTCGYAYAFVDPQNPGAIDAIYAGNIDLSLGPYEAPANQPAILRHCLERLSPDLVAFEDVKFTPAATGFTSVQVIMARAARSTEFFGGLKATVSTWAVERERVATAIPIGTIKRRATGKGNASKEDVMAAASRHFGVELDPKSNRGDDNVADAIWCLVCALEQIGGGVTPAATRRRRSHPDA